MAGAGRVRGENERMTFPEVLEVGKTCLEEYHSRLKKQMKGKKPFRSGEVFEKKRRLDFDRLSSVTKEEIERVSKEVLEELVGLDGGFWLSEPMPSEDIQAKENDTVYHNDFYLSFTHGYNKDIRFRELLWVACWYY